MTIFARTKTPALETAAPHAAVMPGFKVPRLPREKKWQRRGLLTLLAALCFIYSFLMLLLPMQLKVPFAIPLIVMVMFVIWALPVGRRAPGKLSERLFWAYSITLLLWPNYLAIALPGLPWITAARLFATPMLFLILIHASSSLPFKQTMTERLALIRPLWIMVAIFAVIQVISVVVSPQPFLTLNRVFNNQVMWTGMFFAAVWVLKSPRSVERWFIAYVVMVFILGLLAVWEARLQQVIWANSVPAIFQIDDPNVQKILSGSFRLTGQYRVQTTATTPLSFAELMAMAVPFLLYLLHKYPRVWVFLGCLIVEGLIIYGLIQADARLGFVGLLVGHLLYLLFYVIDRRRNNPKSLIGMALVVAFPVIIVMAVMAVLFIGRIRVRVLGSGQHTYSNEARVDQMNAAFERIWGSPVFGFGAGEGAQKLGFANAAGEVTIDSYYLATLMDYGFVGFVTYYGMLIYAIYVCAKLSMSARVDEIRWMSAAVGIFLAEFLVIKSVLAQEANHPLAFIALGLVATLAYSAKQTKHGSSGNLSA